MITKSAKWTMDSDGTWLCFKVDNAEAVRTVANMKPDTPYNVEIKQYKAKRSLDANAYFWVLVGKLSAVLNVPPKEIYQELIKGVGDNYTVLPIKTEAVSDWRQIWGHNGEGWICDDLGKSKLKGFTNVRCFYGSSMYDSAQMSRLINLTIDECKKQGIETATPDEIKKLLDMWKERFN